MPCPGCTPGAPPVCTATALHALYGTIHCLREAGHYDEDAPIDPEDTSSWHRGTYAAQGLTFWADSFDGAVPHRRPARLPGICCPTCGPTTAEQHPARDVVRCANCKEHLGAGRIPG